MIGGGKEKRGHGIRTKRRDLIQRPRNVQVEIEIHKWGTVVGRRTVVRFGEKGRRVIGIRLGHDEGIVE